MREAEVRALLVDPATKTPVILLKDRNSTKAMPIWIAEPEAISIALELQGQRFPRPLPHDLMKELLTTLGATLVRVVITQMKDNIFYAKLVLHDAQSRVKELDSRPSDAIALALRTQAPIFIADEVFEKAAIESPFFAEEEQFERFVDQELSFAELKRRLKELEFESTE